MAEPIKSVLLVDFDSLHRSLTAGGGEAAARMVTKVSGWISGLQSGRLLGPVERSFIVKRCYADPKAIGDNRAGFTGAGFRMIDCASTGTARGVDLMMAMDAVEHLNDEDTVDEFVLLSGESTLAPLLTRLKQANRRTAIYADTHTAQGYRALADSVLDIAAFAEFLLTHDAPEGTTVASVDRAEVEGFARRIHAATNIPLFSPRTFAELFRLLTEEIVANGYHFQTTAKNVADRLSQSGRSVTRRQVVFIVKGLALKGHVFSTTDSPKKLAEVFREQALYLIEQAGLKLDEPQERILSAWLVDRASPTVGRPPAATAPPPKAASAAALNGGRSASPEIAEAASVPAAATPVAPAPKPMPAAAKTSDKPAEKPATVSPPERSAPLPPPREPSTERPTASATPAPPSTTRPERAPAAMISPDDARAAIAAKIAQSVRPKPAQGRPASATPGKPAAPPPPSTASASPSSSGPAQPADEEPGSIESSILAAIAEAVDVLVEDGAPDDESGAAPAAGAGSGRKRPGAPTVPARRPSAEVRPSQPPPTPAKAKPEPRRQEGDDIGDEIQRIIATYNRNRKDEPSPE